MAAVGLKSYILDNNFKSGLLLAGFPVLLIGVAYGIELILMGIGALPTSGQLGGDLGSAFRMLAAGAPLAFTVAGVWYLIAYASQGALIAMTTGARSASRQDEPEIYNLLENLCISRGLATPSLRIIEADALNAYATGLKEGQYSITVTRGLIQTLDLEELEAVMGHELTHIINRDTRLMVICAVFAGIISLVAQMLYRAMFYTRWGGRRGGKGGGAILILIGLAFVFIGYALAIVLRFALSQKREFLADAGSVELTKNPDAMIRALKKISGHAEIKAPGEVQTLFFESRSEGLASLFETHPRIEKRIEALVKYAGGRIDPVVETAPAAEASPHRPGPWG
ncbi:MAG: M48 family metallopeptidase [Caulobacteraceae bacterium]